MNIKLLFKICIFIIIFSFVVGCDTENQSISFGNENKSIEQDNEQQEETVTEEIEENEEVDGEQIEEESEQKEEKKKEKINYKIDVDEELNFEQFDAWVKTVKVYEKNDRLLADLKLEWKNRAYDYGDEMTFYVATLFEVKQGDTELEEIKDRFNPENKISNDVFIPNAVGGTDSVRLTYELIDAETPIDIIFTPTTETEDSGVVTIDIKQ